MVWVVADREPESAEQLAEQFFGQLEDLDRQLREQVQDGGVGVGTVSGCPDFRQGEFVLDVLETFTEFGEA
jgi:hypothetical protein